MLCWVQSQSIFMNKIDFLFGFMWILRLIIENSTCILRNVLLIHQFHYFIVKFICQENCILGKKGAKIEILSKR